MELVYQIYRQMKSPENTQKTDAVTCVRLEYYLFFSRSRISVRSCSSFVGSGSFSAPARRLFQLRLCHIHGLDNQKYDERMSRKSMIVVRNVPRPSTTASDTTVSPSMTAGLSVILSVADLRRNQTADERHNDIRDKTCTDLAERRRDPQRRWPYPSRCRAR